MTDRECEEAAREQAAGQRWFWVGTGVVTACAVVGLALSSRLELRTQARPVEVQAALAPTAHPDVPRRIDQAWLVPDDAVRQARAARADVKALRAAVEASRASRHTEALTLLDKAALTGTPLEPYAEYYRGLTELRLRRAAAARARLSALRASLSQGRLRQLVLSAEAEAALSAGDPAGAVTLFEEMYPGLTSGRDVILDQWATALRASGRPQQAAHTWLRLYYEFPTSGLARSAAAQADAVLGGPARGTRDTFPKDLARAEALISVGRAAEGLSTLQAILPLATAAEQDRVRLRVAEASCVLKRCAAQIDTLRDLASRGVNDGETAYLLMTAYRQAGRTADFEAQVLALAARPPGASVDAWAERALNELGTHYIRTSRDAQAMATFKTLFDRSPGGRYAERAAWKYGWWSYRAREYQEAVRVFDSAAAAIPRANTRPAWMYWSGRAHEALRDRDAAVRRLTLATIDYGQSYYGRLSTDALVRLGAPVPTQPPHGYTRAASVVPIEPAADATDAAPVQLQAITSDETPASFGADTLPPTADAIEWLVSAGLYEDAQQEVRYAQRAWGRHPMLDATLAWTYRQVGEIRPAINTMRQAYPQYLSVQGELLPREVQEVIFPIDYVPLIKRYAKAHGLDPFMVAALIGQESSYVADVKSPANAWGLMQILPSTGRQLARLEGIAPFRTGMLTNPEINVRLGTRFFASLIKRLGGVHYALAGYNAGESRVIRWKNERGPLEQPEFVDDIPFPETQIYVKKILGTAVDYRRVYGDLLTSAE